VIREATAAVVALALGTPSADNTCAVSVVDTVATVVVGKHKQPVAVRLAVGLKSSCIIGKVTYSQRNDPTQDYRPTLAKRNNELRYEADLPFADAIDYYLTAYPERGQSMSVGSPDSPLRVETANLPRQEGKGGALGALGTGAGTVLALIAGIAGAGVVGSGPPVSSAQGQWSGVGPDGLFIDSLSAAPVACAADLTLDLRVSDGHLTGTWTSTSRAGNCLPLGTRLQGDVQGNVDHGNVIFTASATLTFRGSVATDRMSGTFEGGLPAPSGPPVSGRWSVTRQGKTP